MIDADRFLYRQFKGQLLMDANAYREFGKNHRGFKVGCAVLARKPTAVDADEIYSIFLGHNTKMDPAGSDRCCAEEHALKQAEEAGYTTIIAIAVMAPLQPDDESGNAHPTTHCCGTCRRMYAEGRYGVAPDTILLTGNPEDVFVIEEHTVLEMCRKHGDGHLFEGK